MKFNEILASIREGLIILVFVLLLLAPSWVNNRLIAAGFKSVDMGFAQWEAALEESKQNLVEAERNARETQVQLEQVSLELDRWTSLNDRADPRELSLRAKSLKTNIDSTQAELQRFDNKLNNSVEQHQYLIDELRANKTRRTQ